MRNTPQVTRPLPENARLRCFLIGNEQPLQPVELSPGERPPDGGALHWVDVQGVTREQLGQLLAHYDLHSLHVDAFSEPGHLSRVVPINGSLFLEFSVLSDWELASPQRISILQRKDLLITVHAEPVQGLEDVIKQLSVQTTEWKRNTSVLLYHLLDHLVDDTFQHLMLARQSIVALNDLYDETPDRLEDQDIHGTRRSISRLAIACEDQYYVISSLQTLEQDILDLELPREYMRDLLSHAQYANRYVTRLDDRAKELKFLISTNLQLRSEGRLRVLTVIMAIFTPLTFLAGIYGMNFHHMPELGWQYGYYGILSLMGLVAVGLLFFFWRRGWFD